MSLPHIPAEDTENLDLNSHGKLRVPTARNPNQKSITQHRDLLPNYSLSQPKLS
ncbi:hypothetical protein BofuT4_uP104560.1 [Botrytis cinerea T4]|uniref:Uncharacterized protein n=1 Tax=Botryotinia fuckeliana (strain T4) TaxID=999810 RepID=G2YAJ9_BOTF4|nr:hypothetical protein BofuT4_uP104560.1 [Botrytis cinerea T4]